MKLVAPDRAGRLKHFAAPPKDRALRRIRTVVRRIADGSAISVRPRDCDSVAATVVQHEVVAVCVPVPINNLTVSLRHQVFVADPPRVDADDLPRQQLFVATRPIVVCAASRLASTVKERVKEVH